MMLSYIDDVEQLTGLVAGRLFSEGGDGYMSIKKIAEKAGVSPATVSRVLNNPNLNVLFPDSGIRYGKQLSR